MNRNAMNPARILLTATLAVLVGNVVFAQNRFDTGPPADAVGTPAPGGSAMFSNPGIDDGPPAPAPETGLTTTESPAPTPAPEQPGDSVATQDSASKLKSAPAVARNLVNVIIGAGPMMIPILGCSVLLLMFVLERAITLRRRRVVPKHFVKLFVTELEDGQLKPDEALERCTENGSPISEVFAAAVKKWNRPSVEVEQAVIDAGERVANTLRRYLRLFNGIATVSPLLGLLGTVLGMIEAFNAIASSDAMGRPELLAKGISQALLTTAGGLSVAIPAFIAYMYFTSRVDRLIIEIDGLGQDVVSAIASDAWKAGTKKSRAKAA